MRLPSPPLGALDVMRASCTVRFATLPRSFPFHFVLNQQLDVVQVGSSMERLCPRLHGSSVGEVFSLEFPPVGWSLQHLLSLQVCEMDTGGAGRKRKDVNEINHNEDSC